MNVATRQFLTITEVGMLTYWILATLVALKIIDVPPDYMYSDYQNPLIVIWNWSFFPIDVLFAVTGLASRFVSMSAQKAETLSVVSLSLMFCAGLMAISFWMMQQTFDPFWWAINLWLIILPGFVLIGKFTQT
ncbi:MAG: YvaD family protein [Hyphomicrobiales bacterium]|nr:YvaD family protein [Hyphomicrobiales bacterium]